MEETNNYYSISEEKELCNHIDDYLEQIEKQQEESKNEDRNEKVKNLQINSGYFKHKLLDASIPAGLVFACTLVGSFALGLSQTYGYFNSWVSGYDLFKYIAEGGFIAGITAYNIADVLDRNRTSKKDSYIKYTSNDGDEVMITLEDIEREEQNQKIR